ncbi:hypothetical protein R1flu_027116 [Riccia fluitans]|uniref:Uncharacterized protein n=1 Tax=Riccia fluitans TaxID=41844 RepID=A0ABD1XHV2_9MARC
MASKGFSSCWQASQRPETKYKVIIFKGWRPTTETFENKPTGTASGRCAQSYSPKLQASRSLKFSRSIFPSLDHRLGLRRVLHPINHIPVLRLCVVFRNEVE